MYGRDTISPVSVSFSPFFRTGPIISRAEMYCELTFPGKVTSLFTSLRPVIRSGGKPSLPVYSTSAPKVRRAFTRMLMGRCCMRWVPVRMCVPSLTARKAVRKRMAVPAAMMSMMGGSCCKACTMTRVSSQSDRFPG